MNTSTEQNDPGAPDETESVARRAAERGAGLVEYALLVAFIAIVCVGAVRALGTTTQEPYSEITSGIDG